MDSTKLICPPQKWLLVVPCDSPQRPRLAAQFVLILKDICVLLDKHLPCFLFFQALELCSRRFFLEIIHG